MKLRVILVNYCLMLLFDITTVNGFPAGPALSERPEDSLALLPKQENRNANGEGKQKSNDLKIKLSMGEWQKVRNSFDSEKLHRIDQNRYGFTGAPEDIPVEILKEIIEKRLMGIAPRKRGKSLSNPPKKPPIGHISDNKEEKNSSPKVKSKQPVIGGNVKTIKKQIHVNQTAVSPMPQLHTTTKGTQKEIEIDFTDKVGLTEANAVSDKDVSYDSKQIKIVAYPTSYTASSMQSTTTTSSPSSSSSMPLSSALFNPSSLTSQSTFTTLSSTATASSSSTSPSSLSSSIYITSLSASSSSSSASSSSSTMTSSSTASLSDVSETLSSTSSLYLTSSTLTLSSLLSSSTSSSQPSSSSVSSSSTTSSFSSSSSQSSTSQSSVSLQPKLHILHINIFKKKIKENG